MEYSAHYAYINAFECNLCDRIIEEGKVFIEISSNSQKVILTELKNFK
jgi:hypothetical protein